MHKNTTSLLNNILQYEEIPKRLSLLKDAYKGEECFIISAGPSLKGYSYSYLKEKFIYLILLTFNHIIIIIPLI